MTDEVVSLIEFLGVLGLSRLLGVSDRILVFVGLVALVLAAIALALEDVAVANSFAIVSFLVLLASVTQAIVELFNERKTLAGKPPRLWKPIERIRWMARRPLARFRQTWGKNKYHA